jgi:hypothetical protein
MVSNDSQLSGNNTRVKNAELVKQIRDMRKAGKEDKDIKSHLLNITTGDGSRVKKAFDMVDETGNSTLNLTKRKNGKPKAPKKQRSAVDYMPEIRKKREEEQKNSNQVKPQKPSGEKKLIAGNSKVPVIANQLGDPAKTVGKPTKTNEEATEKQIEADLIVDTISSEIAKQRDKGDSEVKIARDLARLWDPKEVDSGFTKAGPRKTAEKKIPNAERGERFNRAVNAIIESRNALPDEKMEEKLLENDWTAEEVAKMFKKAGPRKEVISTPKNDETQAKNAEAGHLETLKQHLTSEKNRGVDYKRVLEEMKKSKFPEHLKEQALKEVGTWGETPMVEKKELKTKTTQKSKTPTNAQKKGKKKDEGPSFLRKLFKRTPKTSDSAAKKKAPAKVAEKPTTKVEKVAQPVKETPKPEAKETKAPAVKEVAQPEAEVKTEEPKADIDSDKPTTPGNPEIMARMEEEVNKGRELSDVIIQLIEGEKIPITEVSRSEVALSKEVLAKSHENFEKRLAREKETQKVEAPKKVEDKTQNQKPEASKTDAPAEEEALDLSKDLTPEEAAKLSADAEAKIAEKKEGSVDIANEKALKAAFAKPAKNKAEQDKVAKPNIQPNVDVPKQEKAVETPAKGKPKTMKVQETKETKPTNVAPADAKKDPASMTNLTGSKKGLSEKPAKKKGRFSRKTTSKKAKRARASAFKDRAEAARAAQKTTIAEPTTPANKPNIQPNVDVPKQEKAVETPSTETIVTTEKVKVETGTESPKVDEPYVAPTAEVAEMIDESIEDAPEAAEKIEDAPEVNPPTTKVVEDTPKSGNGIGMTAKREKELIADIEHGKKKTKKNTKKPAEKKLGRVARLRTWAGSIRKGKKEAPIQAGVVVEGASAKAEKLATDPKQVSEPVAPKAGVTVTAVAPEQEKPAEADPVEEEKDIDLPEDTMAPVEEELKLGEAVVEANPLANALTVVQEKTQELKEAKPRVIVEPTIQLENVDQEAITAAADYLELSEDMFKTRESAEDMLVNMGHSPEVIEKAIAKSGLVFAEPISEPAVAKPTIDSEAQEHLGNTPQGVKNIKTVLAEKEEAEVQAPVKTDAAKVTYVAPKAERMSGGFKEVEETTPSTGKIIEVESGETPDAALNRDQSKTGGDAKSSLKITGKTTETKKVDGVLQLVPLRKRENTDSESVIVEEDDDAPSGDKLEDKLDETIVPPSDDEAQDTDYMRLRADVNKNTQDIGAVQEKQSELTTLVKGHTDQLANHEERLQDSSELYRTRELALNKRINNVKELIKNGYMTHENGAQVVETLTDYFNTALATNDEAYLAKFTEVDNKLGTFEKELTSAKGSIDKLSTRLNTQKTSVANLKSEFEKYVTATKKDTTELKAKFDQETDKIYAKLEEQKEAITYFAEVSGEIYQGIAEDAEANCQSAGILADYVAKGFRTLGEGEEDIQRLVTDLESDLSKVSTGNSLAQNRMFDAIQDTKHTLAGTTRQKVADSYIQAQNSVNTNVAPKEAKTGFLGKLSRSPKSPNDFTSGRGVI